MSELPVQDALPDLLAALDAQGVAVLQAPPGAGKTTCVPPALLDRIEGRIVMLEPRRLAARAAATRMAEVAGEEVGQTFGYRMRGDRAVSDATRVEVVTEGILTRMIQDDPELPGIGAVIFDEFHERSLNADLGLALVQEARAALRPDLQLVVMSATLDAEPVADLLNAPVVTSEGRSYPVERRWRPRPADRSLRLEARVAGLVRQALEDVPEGDVLAFLPGEGEIRRCLSLLSDCGAEVRPLYGALPYADQRRALVPGQGRKVVLATSIAETSLTIPGIRAVVDGGLARRARFDPASGMSRLVTERVTKAEAAQRAGRAGRVAPGVAYADWTKGEEGGMAAFPPPEIARADLAGLALEIAAWGSEDLPFLTPPPEGALAEARALLTDLDALADGRITEHGRALSRVPAHPRVAHLLLQGGPGAARLAAVVAGRSREVDLSEASMTPEMRAEAKRLRRFEAGPSRSDAQRLALAYPDRVGLRRPGDAPRWLLSGGRGAWMRDGEPLAGARLIVAADLDGEGSEAQVRAALAIGEAELREVLADRIGWVEICEWSERERRVLARRQERLGAIALDDRIWKDAPRDALAAAALEGVRKLGLQSLDWTSKARLVRARIGVSGLRDVTDDGLMTSLADWLLPALGGVRSADDLARLDPSDALLGWLDWSERETLDRTVPSAYRTPLGRSVPIDYSGEVPTVSLRVQEVFGETRHPSVGGQPLRMELLSPGQRPVAVTQDLPGFWAGGYADMRKDMRGRYPKHPWPEDPTQADPTLRAKRRG
ncbi:ATP-dependent helicase HrpB [Jannaschia aquimarina]|uniref:HrpB protein n=1 Tax=Jannaschia aquimarina TaxID=935700 RepID=A0A0D1ECZ8_9RHOB|nr:ATP-dependent helicase HrpB [Jannaschia aquimarina]KIT15604.1 ATP-dependent RNA helicase HrpB [Jannaschia aquimarina]SNT27596.1 ATP-dependent helicase HrpB [Jannaschia aquimarina]